MTFDRLIDGYNLMYAAGLARLRRESQDFVSCRERFLRILAARWLGLPADAGRYFDLAPASISVLGYHGDASIIRKWNLAAISPAQVANGNPG